MVPRNRTPPGLIHFDFDGARPRPSGNEHDGVEDDDGIDDSGLAVLREVQLGEVSGHRAVMEEHPPAVHKYLQRVHSSGHAPQCCKKQTWVT